MGERVTAFIVWAELGLPEWAMYPKYDFRSHSEPHLGSGCRPSGRGGDPL